MVDKSEPEIKDYNGEHNYTKISFWPDLREERFNMPNGLDNDIISLFTKRVYDVAGITPKELKVYLNETRLEVKDFKSYVDLYFRSDEMKKEQLELAYEKDGERWEICATLSDGEFYQVSFVNSICTTLGGTHVNHVSDQIASYVQNLIKKRNKKEIKPSQVKSYLWVFVNCQIVNPAFDSQTKDTLTTKPSKFGSK